MNIAAIQKIGFKTIATTLAAAVVAIRITLAAPFAALIGVRYIIFMVCTAFFGALAVALAVLTDVFATLFVVYTFRCL